MKLLNGSKNEPAASNSENLNIWMNVPTFDLQQERLELRSSSEWRWG